VNLKLTKEQQEVVDHTLGTALVFAVAGAGKTTAMVHRIEKLVRENIFPPERILATSFAKSNVNDLKDALRAWPHCRPVEVRTLHSLGLNIVRLAQQEGHLPKLTFGDNDEESGSANQQLLTLAQGQARQLNMPFVEELDSLDRQDFLDYVGSCKSNLLYADLEAAKLPPAGVAHARQALAPVGPLHWYLDLFRLYEKVRQHRGQITYDDMLLTGWEVLVKYPEVLGKVQQSYECVLVDEFQDVNKAQSEILDLITKIHRNYMTIGDDDQTVYEWRGASPDYILKFQERYAARTYLIADNFRCPAAPLVLANQVIAHNKKRQPKRLSLTQGFRGEAKVYFDQDVPVMARRIVSQIQRLFRDGRTLNDMAILVRLNAQTPHIEQNLIAAKIPYRVSHPFYERAEIKTLIDYCRLAWVEEQMGVGSGNLQGTRLVKEAAESWNNISNRPKRYISKKHRDHIKMAMQLGRASPSHVLMNYAQLIDENWLVERLEKLATEIVGLAGYLDKPAGGALMDLEKKLKYKQFLRESSGFVQSGEAKAASVAAFIDYAHGYETLFAFMQHIRELAKSSAGRPNSDSDPAVTVSTIHKAKGLEWPVVFVPQCNEGMLPFLSDSSNNNLEEERRLFYVALTRTQHSLYLYCVRSEATSSFLEQADWKTALISVATLKKVLAKAPGQWLAEDALFVAKTVPSLKLQRYFELWWEAPPEQQQEIAHTMQRFYAAVEHHDLFRSVRLPPSGVALWRTISPLTGPASADKFPGLERYLPRTRTQPDISEKQKRQRTNRTIRPVTRRQAALGTVRPTSRPGANTKIRDDSLNKGMNDIRNQGKLATDDAIQGLVKNLGETNSVIRYMSRTELRRIGGFRVVEALARSLKSGDDSRTRKDEARKLLELIASTDPDPAARQDSLVVLERIGDGTNSPMKDER